MILMVSRYINNNSYMERLYTQARIVLRYILKRNKNACKGGVALGGV